MAKRGIDAQLKVVDLSADLRLDTPEAYESSYHTPHPHPELLPTAYGLPEINRAIIAGADVVATPGCYPTTTLLGMYPLLRCDGIQPDTPIIVDAKSGVTGAGRKPSLTTHFAEVYSNLTPYKTGRTHRHVGELEQEAHKVNDRIGPVIFCPHLLPVDRGLMSSIYVTLKDSLHSDQAHDLYTEVYESEPLVDVLPPGEQATLKHAVKTNKCVISITPVLERYVHITSVTDNLRKGRRRASRSEYELDVWPRRNLGTTLMADSPTVVKISGHYLDCDELLRQFASIVAQSRERLVIVHGGGKEISQLQQKLDIRPRYVDGLRITDADSLALVEMVLCGSVNKRLVRYLLAAGVDALGLSGVDRGLVRARQMQHETMEMGIYRYR